jgi:hypothetical protein
MDCSLRQRNENSVAEAPLVPKQSPQDLFLDEFYDELQDRKTKPVMFLIYYQFTWKWQNQSVQYGPMNFGIDEAHVQYPERGILFVGFAESQITPSPACIHNTCQIRPSGAETLFSSNYHLTVNV